MAAAELLSHTEDTGIAEEDQSQEVQRQSDLGKHDSGVQVCPESMFVSRQALERNQLVN